MRLQGRRLSYSWLLVVVLWLLCQRQYWYNPANPLATQRDEADVAVGSMLSNPTASTAGMKLGAHLEILQYISRRSGGYIPKHNRHEFPLPDILGSYWWLNQSIPESFSFAQLDPTYTKDYFDFGGHPDQLENVRVYTTLVDQLCRLFFFDDKHQQQRDITSLVEFGNGGGYFAKGFLDMYGSGFVTVEGTGAGVATTLHRYHVPSGQVVQHDLRLPLYLGRRFDVAVCSEVVEHVEPPFAAQIVLTLVLHADVIWFSYKTDSPLHKAWINHPNERPFKLWKNLFEFYGFGVVQLPGSVVRKSFYRGQFLAYNLGNPLLRPPSLEELRQAEAAADALVQAAEGQVYKASQQPQTVIAYSGMTAVSSSGPLPVVH